MGKIAIIEDNKNIRVELAEYFGRNGFEIYCPDGEASEILDMIQKNADLVLLDINLGEDSGFDLCREIRRRSDIPILFVTGRDSELDEIKAMALGGDDYIRKPYSLPVLMAKVRRILERAKSGSPEEIQAGDVRLNVVMGQIQYNGRTLELSKNEMRILYYLFLNRGNVVSKDHLMEYLWENKLYVDENILNVNLSRLRKRLAGIGAKNLILTVPKKGYMVDGRLEG